MRSCKECGVVIDERNRVFCHSMDHANKYSGNPYIKGDCRPCHNRLGRVRHQLKKAHPAPVAGTPCTCCGAVRKLHIDHCHRTDKFRGWICANCNTMLGLAGESRRGLEAGIRYLERSDTDLPSRAVGSPILCGRIPISHLVRSDTDPLDDTGLET